MGGVQQVISIDGDDRVTMFPDVKCGICLFNDWVGFTDPPRSCRYCLSTRDRENFVSVYREPPKEPPKPRKRRVKKPKAEDIPLPAPPRRRSDDPDREYKVLYTDPETGDWFYEINTRDRIGHHKDKVVTDILDILT